MEDITEDFIVESCNTNSVLKLELKQDKNCLWSEKDWEKWTESEREREREREINWRKIVFLA